MSNFHWLIRRTSLTRGYLTYLFERLPNVDTGDAAVIDSLLPWSDALPAALTNILYNSVNGYIFSSSFLKYDPNPL